MFIELLGRLKDCFLASNGNTFLYWFENYCTSCRVFGQVHRIFFSRFIPRLWGKDPEVLTGREREKDKT